MHGGSVTSRLRRLAMAAGAILLGAMSAAAAAPFAVPNPYASRTSNADIAIKKLTVFGDSYSRQNRKAFYNWAEQLLYERINRNTGLPEVATMADFAASGATAGLSSSSGNDFSHQVSRWRATPRAYQRGDLVVVYLGYNDIDGGSDPNGDDLVDKIADYRTALQRIIDSGASLGSRRILLVMPHDWGRSPYYVANGQSELMRQRTQVWNGLLAGLARDTSYTNVLAVDLFTPMECVFNHPHSFGFTNVTDPLPATGNPVQYLYDRNDQFHFGQHGQRLIRQVIQYYLTRGWDTLNTYKDPDTARQQLVADLKAGKVFTIPCSPD